MPTVDLRELARKKRKSKKKVSKAKATVATSSMLNFGKSFAETVMGAKIKRRKP